MLKSEYAITKEKDIPLHEKYKAIQQCFSIVSIDDSGIFELPNLNFSKQYKLSDINFLGVTQAEQMKIIKWFGKVLETIPCRFSYIVANEYVDENAFNNRVLYPLTNDKLDEIKVMFNEVISEKLTDVKQGLYQSIYFTLTCKADDMDDAKSFFHGMDTAIRTAFIELTVEGMTGSVMRELTINERMQLLYNFTHQGLHTQFKFDYEREIAAGRDWLNTIAPASLMFENEMFHLNGKVGKVIYIEEYPKIIEADIISKLASINCTSYISVNCELLPKQVLKAEIARKHLKVGFKIENEKNRNRNKNDFFSDASSSLQVSNSKIEALEKEVNEEDQHYFNTTIVMLFLADNQEQLLSIENKIYSQARIKSIRFMPCFAMQREGINSAIGLGIQEFKHVCNLSSYALATFMPYKTQELNDEGSIYYGVNQLSKNAIFASKKKQKNRNSLFAGQSGSGKTALAKIEMLSAYANYPDDQFLVIDPKSDYINIVKHVDGTVISFDPQAQLFVNPLDVDFTGVEYSELESVIYEKADFIQTLISSYIKRDLSEDELPVLNVAIEKVYSDNYSLRRQMNGIGNTGSEFEVPNHMRSQALIDNESYTDLSPDEQVRQFSPTLQDIYQTLIEMNEPSATHVARMMDTFVNGSLSLFNHRTSVDLNNRFIAFNLSNTQENLRITCMVVMMEMIRNKIRKNHTLDKWTHIYIDEFHELLGIDRVAKFVLKLWKEVRSLGGIMSGITQNMSDLIQSENDVNLSKIFSNTECFFLLSQSAQDKELLMKYLPSISAAMFAYVDGAPSGTGLIRMGTVTVPFDMVLKKNSPVYQLVNSDIEKQKGA